MGCVSYVIYDEEKQVIRETEEGWEFDRDFFRSFIKSGFPLENANKHIHLQVKLTIL